MKTLLFIGGAGFIGSNIIKSLNYSDFRIHVLEPTFADISRLHGLNIIIHRGLLSDTNYLENIIKKEGINIIVHLVSTLITGSSYDDFINEINNVVFPTIKLMQLCSSLKIDFIYFSSGGTVYGERKDINPFKEIDATAPISYYGWSKQMMENGILFEHRTNQLNYLILRPSNPYGPGQSLYGKQGLIAVCIGKMLSKQPIGIWGSGNSMRDYIYIDDLSKIFKFLIEKRVINQIINIGSGIGYTINDIINFLEDISKQHIDVKRLPERNMDVSNMVLDTSLLKSIYNFQLTPIKEGIKKFVDFSIKAKE